MPRRLPLRVLAPRFASLERSRAGSPVPDSCAASTAPEGAQGEHALQSTGLVNTKPRERAARPERSGKCSTASSFSSWVHSSFL